MCYLHTNDFIHRSGDLLLLSQLNTENIISVASIWKTNVELSH